jgi:endogenous inhibitor of DNA gyrase (YacG/DUF329 family)
MAGATDVRLVSCPQCGRLTPWNTSNAYRPFCSERCKMVDLGQWATEAYRIAATETDSDQPEGKG